MPTTKIKTLELFVEALNEDGVTNYPFETPILRQKLFDNIQELITSHNTAVLVDADIDNLKQLNHAIGHLTANLAIKHLITLKEQLFAEVSWVKELWVYRPQAGGDEFRILLAIDDREIQREQIEKAVTEKVQLLVCFQPKTRTSISIECSCGVIARAFTGNENPGTEFQAMEREAEVLLAEQKLLKAEKALKDLVVLGEKLDLEEYITQVCELWGAKRVGSNALKIILNHIARKARDDAKTAFKNGHLKHRHLV